MSQNILLISDTIIKERTTLHGNVDPKMIYPDIKAAQDLFIHPILGTALFDKMQTLVAAGVWTGDAAPYKILLDNYIIDALMNYTLSELPQGLTYQFTNKGLVKKSGENVETSNMSDLLDIANRYRSRAEQYGKRLTKYLEQNAHTLFPEYINPGNKIDTIHPDRNDFTMPVYLGDEGRCHDDFGFTRKPYTT